MTWTKMDNGVIDRLREIGHAGLVVYSYLARRANSNAEAWPSVATIAKETIISVRRVRRILAHLEALGFLTRERRVTISGSSASTLYRLVNMTPERESGPTAPLPGPAVHPSGAPTPGTRVAAGTGGGWPHSTRNKNQLIKKTQRCSPRRKQDDRDYSLDFLNFWTVYPTQGRGKKPDAWRAWRAAITRVAPEVILAAAQRYAASDKGQGPYVGMASTWLNADRWEDAPGSWDRIEEPLPSKPKGPAQPPYVN